MSEKNTPKVEKEKSKFKLSKLQIALIGIICALAIAITVTACLAVSYDKIYGGISVCGISVNNLYSEDAAIVLEEALTDISPKIAINIDNEVISLNFRDFGEYDFESSAKNAFNHGRDNFFSKLFTYATPFVNRDLAMEFYIDENAVAEFLHKEYEKFGASYTDTSYEIKDDKLIITSGHSGNTVNTEEIIEQFKQGISTGNDVETNALIVHKDYEGIDVDAVYKAISGKPENAYYDKESGKIVPHKLGYSFDVNSAKEQTADVGENTSVEINLTIEYPEVTEAVLTGKMFEDVLASYTTKYNPNEVDRTHNMSLAGQKVDGTVLAPGQEFSYNEVVGERTVAKGYRNAKIFENGRVVDGLAGGICQVSTTIYNAILYANLEIVERKNHSFPVSYAPMGQDATVVMGAIDFRFKNSTQNPIKITCSISGGNCTVSVLGIKENNYKVEINNVITGSTPFKTEYENDETLEAGKEVIKQKGSNGYTIKSTRTVYENGVKIKTESIPSSYYIPLVQIVARNENAVVEETPADGEEPTDTPDVTDTNSSTPSDPEVEETTPEQPAENQDENTLPPELGLDTEIYE